MKKPILLILSTLICIYSYSPVMAEDIAAPENGGSSTKYTNPTEKSGVWFNIKPEEEKDNSKEEHYINNIKPESSENQKDDKSDKKDSDKDKDSKAESKDTSKEKDSDKSDSKDDIGTPFDKDKTVKAEESSKPTIDDIETAKICGINSVKDGYPKEGTLDALGADRLRLRSWPWGNVIGMYHAGTSVQILGESGEFYLVSINGTQGYMHKNYITTSDKAASGIDPYYPGNTRSGGALSKEDGVKASKDGSEGKVPTVSSSSSSSTSVSSEPSKPGTVTKNGNYVCMSIQKLCQMTTNTPAPGSACGPTSLSMVLSYYGKGDAAKLVSNVYSISGCTQANGTGHDGLARAAKNYGLNASWHYSSTQSWCRQQLEAGKPLICHVNHHYVVMKGMDANGNVIINDPAKSVVERTMSWSEFAAWWNKSNSPMSCMVIN